MRRKGLLGTSRRIFQKLSSEAGCPSGSVQCLFLYSPEQDPQSCREQDHPNGRWRFALFPAAKGMQPPQQQEHQQGQRRQQIIGALEHHIKGQQRPGHAAQHGQRRGGNHGERSGRPSRGNGDAPHGQQSRPPRRSKPNVWEPKKRQEPSEMTFEDMLSRFKQNSEERMCDIKRNTERKNRSKRK